MLTLPKMDMVFIGDREFPKIVGLWDRRVLHYSCSAVIVLTSITNLDVVFHKEKRVLNSVRKNEKQNTDPKYTRQHQKLHIPLVWEHAPSVPGLWEPALHPLCKIQQQQNETLVHLHQDNSDSDIIDYRKSIPHGFFKSQPTQSSIEQISNASWWSPGAVIFSLQS